MAGKKRPIMKLLRQLMSQQYPPTNVAPWVNPNNKLKAVISKSTRGRLGQAVQDAQRNALQQHVQRIAT
ncbi:hypothetical protein PSENEW3_00003092 [Picochlorum sp. SENEW3]|nr:hypothetical protein PSENEW3_00003092 [Picochlorum sp. SENEW3]